MDTPIQPLLSVQDVAEILGVSRAAVYSLVKIGQLVTVDIGLRKTRFRKADILRFIGEAESEPVPRGPGG
jgi:excisionase family DNA binding protein